MDKNSYWWKEETNPMDENSYWRKEEPGWKTLLWVTMSAGMAVSVYIFREPYRGLYIFVLGFIAILVAMGSFLLYLGSFKNELIDAMRQSKHAGAGQEPRAESEKEQKQDSGKTIAN